MQELFYGITSFVIAALAFWLGAVRLFTTKKPLYMKLLVCAAGCFMLEQQLYLINIWCDVREMFSIGILGILGCNCFMLSANYGTLDKIVDDGSKKNKAARFISYIAPIIVSALTFNVFLVWKDKDIICGILWALMLLPAIPASYLNLKHILLPMDDFGFLRATRFCNIFALVLYIVMATFAACSASNNSRLAGILSCLMSLAVLSITIFAIKGAKQWGT